MNLQTNTDPDIINFPSQHQKKPTNLPQEVKPKCTIFPATKKYCKFFLKTLGTSLFNRSISSFLEYECSFKLISSIISSFKNSDGSQLNITNLQLISKSFYYTFQNFDLLHQMYSKKTFPTYTSVFEPQTPLLPVFSCPSHKFTIHDSIILTICSNYELNKFNELLMNQKTKTPFFARLNNDLISLNSLLLAIISIDLERIQINNFNQNTIHLFLNTIFKNIKRLPNLTNILIGKICTSATLTLSDLSPLPPCSLKNIFVLNIESDSTLDMAQTLNSLGIIYNALGDKNNIRLALSYWIFSLELRKKLLHSNHIDIIQSLNNLGEGHFTLADKNNIQIALQYWEDSLRKLSKLPTEFPNTKIRILDNMGKAYFALKEEKDITNALVRWKESYEIKKEIFSGNHLAIAQSLNFIAQAYYSSYDFGKKEAILSAIQSWESYVKMRQDLATHNHPNLIEPLDNLGTCYYKLGEKSNIQQALKYWETCLELWQKFFPNHHTEIANLLYKIGVAYHNMTKNQLDPLSDLEPIKKGLVIAEQSLKIRQNQFLCNHSDIAQSLETVGISYKCLGDINKALEYYKQAYSIYFTLFGQQDPRSSKLKSRIKLLQPSFFRKPRSQNAFGGNQVGDEYRRLIFSRGLTTFELITIKCQIQENVLNRITSALPNHGWSDIGTLGEDWGVKRYIDKNYLLEKLGPLANDSNAELALMLCFEAIAIGIMTSASKPYTLIQNFTKQNPDLVKNIAEHHPEFFIDITIIEECVSAMSQERSFKQHLAKHIKHETPS